MELKKKHVNLFIINKSGRGESLSTLRCDSDGIRWDMEITITRRRGGGVYRREWLSKRESSSLV